jgi:DNA modification methylase
VTRALELPESALHPTFFCGDALDALRQLPDESIDCVVTSPPYWRHRRYSGGGIGQERRIEDYVAALLAVFAELHRALRRQGSFWLNIGDTYHDKALVGVPWRVALAMTDGQGWVLRNEVIWNKIKGGPDNTPDRLRCVHETVFHFVKERRGYFYDVAAIRTSPRAAKVIKGAVVSATGVTGVRYRRQIELSTALSPEEKTDAIEALQEMLDEVARGELSDFRMIIRGQQRTTHSDSTKISGRARELQERGFYFLRYHPDGAKPGDVWDIMPEDTHRRRAHFAPFPEDLCRIPILATCPVEGVVLDPFCGTGTTCLVATRLGRRSLGIDCSEEYLATARERVGAISV